MDHIKLIVHHKTARPVMCLETGKIYSSMYEAAREWGFKWGHDQLKKVLDKNYPHKTFGGRHWRYLNKNEFIRG